MKEELEPVRERFEELTGREEEPEPGRLEKIRSEIRDIERRAEGEARSRALAAASSAAGTTTEVPKS